jgi:hypothetical protein
MAGITGDGPIWRWRMRPRRSGRAPPKVVSHLAAQLGLDPLLFLPDLERRFG